MNRIPASRRNRILVWTGAALAWGTALTASRLEPARANEAALVPTTVEAKQVRVQAAMPAAPEGGLTILRYTPVAEPQAEVRTVYVQRPGTPSAAGSASAPAPRSTGS